MSFYFKELLLLLQHLHLIRLQLIQVVASPSTTKLSTILSQLRKNVKMSTSQKVATTSFSFPIPMIRLKMKAETIYQPILRLSAGQGELKLLNNPNPSWTTGTKIKNGFQILMMMMNSSPMVGHYLSF